MNKPMLRRIRSNNVTALSPIDRRNTAGLLASAGAWEEISMIPLKKDNIYSTSSTYGSNVMTPKNIFAVLVIAYKDTR
ncbi:MAG: hypothetical protein ACJAYM_002376 [Flavobacteriales bacterium]|jgi:hypothetical protein